MSDQMFDAAYLIGPTEQSREAADQVVRLAEQIEAAPLRTTGEQARAFGAAMKGWLKLRVQLDELLTLAEAEQLGWHERDGLVPWPDELAAAHAACCDDRPAEASRRVTALLADLTRRLREARA